MESSTTVEMTIDQSFLRYLALNLGTNQALGTPCPAPEQG